MQDEILSLFPPHIHTLTLVSDPDSLLADEALLAALNERGFTMLTESDSILLRNRLESLKPWTIDKPVIVITPAALEALPYDLWQLGQRLQLTLHDYYPNLVYPLLQSLMPYQLARLNDCPPPQVRLGQQLSAEYILRYVFDLSLEHLDRPSNLVAWLDQYHNGLGPLPTTVLESLLAQLGKFPVYSGWPLRELLEEKAYFNEFLQTQWSQYVNKSMGDWGTTSQYIIKPGATTLLSFGHDTALQDTLPRLVRNGSLAPLEIDKLSTAPAWAMPALLVSRADRRPQRVAEICANVLERLDNLTNAARWEDWKPIAHLWAELALLRAETPASQSVSSFSDLQSCLDMAFTTWLEGRYTSLGAQGLPFPHHVRHVVHYLNYRREQGQEKIALIVLDGLALMDWLVIRNAWQARHSNWHIDESMLLAQVPTITAISRQALVSGLRPADFAASIQTNSQEAHQWGTFWMRSGLSAEACAYVSADFRSDPVPVELSDPRLRMLCLVERTIDELVHGNVLGNAELIARLKVWLDEKKNPLHLESAISELLGGGFDVFLTSDHGHIEAIGIGQPNEGILAQTRGRRVRIYSDRNIALQTQSTFQSCRLWENDDLLPNNLYAILPSGRGAFVPKNQPILTHGGISIDEVVVPFIEIKYV